VLWGAIHHGRIIRGAFVLEVRGGGCHVLEVRKRRSRIVTMCRSNKGTNSKGFWVIWAGSKVQSRRHENKGGGVQEDLDGPGASEKRKFQRYVVQETRSGGEKYKL